MRRLLAICFSLTVALACGHTTTSRIALMSFGDLEGKVVPQRPDGQTLQGEDCSKIAGDSYSLSEAARNALKGTAFDTLTDVEVEATTGLFVPSNCIKVRGVAFDSRTLEASGGEQ
jgi:hypothetical protein